MVMSNALTDRELDKFLDTGSNALSLENQGAQNVILMGVSGTLFIPLLCDATGKLRTTAT